MKKRNCILSLLITSSMLISNASTAFSYELIGGKFKGGISNLKYKIDSSASDYSSTISKAATSWNQTDTSTYFRKATTGAKITINANDKDFENDKDNANVIAWTKFLKMDNGNWGAAKITIHTSKYEALSYKYSMNKAQRQQGTIAHELGHTLGLDENNTMPNSIMCQSRGGRRVYTPQEDDINGVNDLYNYNTSSYNSTTYDDAMDNDILDISNVSEIETIQDFEKDYNSLLTLSNASNSVIKGQVQNIKTLFDEDGIYTTLEIKVMDKLLGSLNSGDTITLKVKGGTLEGQDAKDFRILMAKSLGLEFNPDEVSNKKIEEVVDDRESFKVGDTSIFFLKDNNDGNYHITGSSQGIFNIKNNFVELNKQFKNKFNGLKSIANDKFLNDLESVISFKYTK